MDPLDGTSNYAHGFPWFCISIALHYQEKPLAGCIYHPIFGERFFAFRGKGSFLNRKKIRVSKITKLEDSLLGTGFYYSVGKSLEDELKIFGRIQSKALGVRRPGSAALDLAYVACGRYDGFWERGLAPWDVAAGSLIVEEAGGRVTGYQGQPTYLEESEIVATNGALHKKILALI
jgi:myo-inositol-1(or 4)-monophosphatase